MCFCSENYHGISSNSTITWLYICCWQKWCLKCQTAKILTKQWCSPSFPVEYIEESLLYFSFGFRCILHFSQVRFVIIPYHSKCPASAQIQPRHSSASLLPQNHSAESNPITVTALSLISTRVCWGECTVSLLRLINPTCSSAVMLLAIFGS